MGGCTRRVQTAWPCLGSAVERRVQTAWRGLGSAVERSWVGTGKAISAVFGINGLESSCLAL